MSLSDLWQKYNLVFLGVIVAAVLAAAISYFLTQAFGGSINIVSDLHLGPLSIHLYSLTMALGILVAIWLSRRLAVPKVISESDFYDLVLAALVFGFVGARLFFVWGNWSYFANQTNEIWQIWQGGLSFYGGLVGGGIALLGLHVFKKFDFLALLDALAPSLALGQAIGRWGNFFNQEAYGTPTDLPWKMYISPEHRLDNYVQASYYHPTFLYESIGLGLLFIILWCVFPKARLGSGLVFGLYALSSGILRTWLETLRLDPLVWSGLKISSILAIVLSTIGLLLLAQYHAKQASQN